jgi:hypothetical protein
VLDYDEEEHYASSLFLNSGAVHFSVAASASSVNQDDSVTLTATLSATVGSQTPSGTVSFYDNGTLLQTTPVSQGTATFMLTSLPVGSNVITAAYSGDASFNSATSSASVAVTVATLPPAFTMTTPAPFCPDAYFWTIRKRESEPGRKCDFQRNGDARLQWCT